MDNLILVISERGQITIPLQIRKDITVKHLICTREGQNIILKPLQTREEFLDELDQAEQEWGKKGGLNLKQIKKKYNL